MDWMRLATEQGGRLLLQRNENPMKWTQMLIPTMKETPSEAEIPSHQLMIRAGMIRKLASGTYTYLPLGWKSILKIIAIVREEMNRAGAQEISMPILQPMELWQKTGRDVVFQDIMCHFTDRHERENVLAPTAEEVVTAIAASEVSSYKQLPINLYQINTKFRDEFRPRFGVLRSREFIMKDAYSFDATVEGLNESYKKMYDAYCRIFTRCGLKYVTVEADSGGMGGTDTEEFMIPCPAGEDILISSDKGNYAANVEKAQTGTRNCTLEGEPVGELENVHTPGCKSIEELVEFFKTQLKTKVKPQNLLKTLVCKTTAAEGQASHVKWVLAVVRGDHELNESKLKSEVLARFPDLQDVQLTDEASARDDGFPIGFVGPHVIHSGIAGASGTVIFVDPDAAQGGFWVTGANKIDYHVKKFNWKRDVLAALGNEADKRVLVADIRNALQGDPSPRNDGGILQESRGIEVGHVFKLGTKYSAMLGATFLDDNRQSHPCIMGCYGIGVNRIMASAIEMANDADGILWPISISPFEVLVTSVNPDDPEVSAAAEEIYQQLRRENIDVLLDDRALRGGVKFKDADLIGIPIRITVGKKALDEGNVEIKLRRDAEKKTVARAGAANCAVEWVRKLYAELNP